MRCNSHQECLSDLAVFAEGQLHIHPFQSDERTILDAVLGIVLKNDQKETSKGFPILTPILTGLGFGLLAFQEEMPVFRDAEKPHGAQMSGAEAGAIRTATGVYVWLFRFCLFGLGRLDTLSGPLACDQQGMLSDIQMQGASRIDHNYLIRVESVIWQFRPFWGARS